MRAQSLPTQVAVIGLGYVGLPLAKALGWHLPTLGFDINATRVSELARGFDANEVNSGEDPPPPHLRYSKDPLALKSADFLIVAVPTPVDKAKRPDLSYLTSASALIGRALAAGNRVSTEGERCPVVVFESTVFPGCTEEVCAPIIERESGLKSGQDFKVGYSPERINPGDREHTLDKVVKIVSGQDQDTTERVARVYSLVVKAGVYKAPDIRTAEAAKVIENIQRDLNIALMNELSMLFHRMDIDFREVLRAARTKWNFLPFTPGLVGGHCIPEDPYYLTYKAQEMGYHPEVILAGRRINDSMGAYVAQETVKLLIKTGKTVQGARVLVLGASFKEDVRDTRNTKVVPLVQELEGYGCKVQVHDPIVGADGVQQLRLTWAPEPFDGPSRYDAVVLAVPHQVFLHHEMQDYLALLRQADGGTNGVLVDVKGVLPRSDLERTGLMYWSL